MLNQLLRTCLPLAGLVVANLVVGDEPNSAPVNFSAEVRPLLSDHCFACHGPDEHDRQADLRLDTAEGVAAVIDPDALDASLLLERIVSDDPDLVMPPPDYNKPLSNQQQDLLRTWIASGAVYESHWAFESPVKADVAQDTENPIDYFIDRKIDAEGLKANSTANDHALLRRVCLDLTGLPPTRQQIERLNEGSLNYEKLVDEQLNSPAFGQHFGRFWLDLVRYADTHGLHLDNYREMWPYRDWVINAVNQNMPFDQFVTEQLAGDLFPDASLAQKIASGFNRLNVTTSEGGSIYDEVFARNVIDRTDAFGTIFMGMTTQCAVCHDHKFDPITQKDYYSLFAFFNSLDGRALDGNKKDHPPVIRYPSEDQTRELKSVEQRLVELGKERSGDLPTVDAAQEEWETTIAKTLNQSDDSQPDAEESTFSIVPSEASSQSKAELSVKEDGLVVQAGEVAAKDVHTLIASLPSKATSESDVVPQWQTLRLNVDPDPKTNRAGVSGNGNAVLSEIVIETRNSTDGNDTSRWQPLNIRSATADVEQDTASFAVTKAIDKKIPGNEGWAVDGHGKKGGRQADFSIPQLANRIAEGHDQIRVQLKYQSVYAKHQFYGVRLKLSDRKGATKLSEPITFGAIHQIGPFPVETSSPGFNRTFASQQADFDAEETFQYEEKTYSWNLVGELDAVQVHELPSAGDTVTVNLFHFELDSPKNQAIELLLGSSDGHGIYFEKKRFAYAKRLGAFRPLEKTYKLELKKGKNDVYLKFVSATSPGQWNYAFRSDQIESPIGVARLASIPRADRTKAQQDSLRRYYREVACTHPDWLALNDEIAGAQRVKDDLSAAIPTTLVWKELESPREAKLLVRGQYDQPGEVVTRQTPAFLPPMPEGAASDRMGLATWLMSAEHPLAARVAVNRYWQALFGVGLVKSSEDFGNQGDTPSHPQLLDYLAVDFRENGWNVKRLIRSIVTSNAYKRDAKVSPAMLAKDPENRLYARGPRHRLDAEVLRDQSLALAGLLRHDAGGPSVRPPQPKGLWYAVGYTRSDTANFVADKEMEKIFRRSVYIFWKRTSAPPQMSTFDAPSRESCTARRERTNTPLQALLLMNEHQYLQAAKHMAIRAIKECPSDESADRIAWLFETATARPPSEPELTELVRLLNQLIQHYQGNLDDAKALLAIDEIAIEELPPANHAAWMMVASTLLNLDEVVNK